MKRKSIVSAAPFFLYDKGVKPILVFSFAAVAILFSAFAGWHFIFPPKEIKVDQVDVGQAFVKKSKEELIAEALEKSSRIKGLYMTADVASYNDAGATKLRRKIIELAETTEVNGVVIDVKEVCGPDYDEANLKKLLDELKSKNIWAIARIAVFKDASQIEAHPEWYLKRKSSKAVRNECARKRHLMVKHPEGKKTNVIFWRDKRGGYWLDPSHREARNYILEFSKKMIDLGFDELQFDYIRFPSDGDVEKAIYPVWDGQMQKYEVMKNFFEFLNRGLKEYKPDIILSADLFGYAAIRSGDVGIGQRLDDVGDNFDYISFMVYPSHYYSGLYLPADQERNLPAVNLTLSKARANPDIVVYRSLLFARDFLDGRIATSTSGMAIHRPTSVGRDGGPEGLATSTVTAAAILEVVENPQARSRARLRPWLEDFFHEEDRVASGLAGVKKVKMQIEAAEKAEEHGWLLWNAANLYTENALKEE